jgi:hypothetical protein
VLIFLGIGLLGFASAQLTAKLLPQRNELSELKVTMDRQVQLLQELSFRLSAVTSALEEPSNGGRLSEDAGREVSQVA